MKKGRFTFSCHEWQIMSPTTLQYSPLQPSTDQHSPVQPSSAHFSQLQPSTAKYSPLQPTTAHFSPVQQSKAKYSPLQPTTAQYPLCLEFIYRFLLGLSRIKRSQVISRGKIGPTGFVSVLQPLFLGQLVVRSLTRLFLAFLFHKMCLLSPLGKSQKILLMRWIWSKEWARNCNEIPRERQQTR